MGIGGITVGAHEVLKSAGEIKNNEEVVLENQNGLALYEKENSGAIQMEVETDMILPENLYKDGIPIAKYIMEFKTERNGSVPECYLDNGTMIVLTDFDGDTWNMKTGDTFILDFIQSDSDERGKTCKVITMEPFGYGLSDPADTERSIENIVEELHACLEKIGVRRYYLMAHSISGLYSLYYANTYPEEVRGFIGIDSSVPKQNENEPFDTTKLNLLMAYLSKTKNVLGISRIFSIGNPEKAIYADQNYSYSQEDLEVFRILSLDTSYNKTVMNELKQVENNLKIVRNMKFPKEVPVLNFVSKDNCEIFPEWEKLHKSVMGDNQESELITLTGGHYLHFEQKEMIVDLTCKFAR